MEAPLIAIIAGGFLGEFLIGWFVLAGVGLVVLGVISICGLIAYAKCLRTAAHTSRAWLVNLVASPLASVPLGWLILLAAWGPAQADTHVNEKTPLFAFTVVACLYGVFLAPFVSPRLLMAEPGGYTRPMRLPAQLKWFLSYPSFIILGFSYGLVTLGFTHHLVS
jgi:hypothetical protein